MSGSLSTKARNFIYMHNSSHQLCEAEAPFAAGSYSAGVLRNLVFLTCLQESVTDQMLNS